MRTIEKPRAKIKISKFISQRERTLILFSSPVSRVVESTILVESLALSTNLFSQNRLPFDAILFAFMILFIEKYVEYSIKSTFNWVLALKMYSIARKI